MEKDLSAFGHVRYYYRLGVILCVAQEGTPIIKDPREMVLDRIETVVMAMFNDAALTKVLPVLRAIKDADLL